MHNDNFPDSGEDWSILEWWRNHPRQGLLRVEVVIGYAGPGDWPNPRSHRRIDAVHFPGHPSRTARYWVNSDIDDFAATIAGAEVELVEAKNELTFAVIGQCIAGRDMLSRAYPQHGPLRQVAVVRSAPDPALRWVCDRRSIELAAISQGRIDKLRAASLGLTRAETGAVDTE
jgi:hypothetical protein